MEKEEYLAYIAHFVDAISPITPKYEYREYFASVLGNNLFDSDIKELKSLARHLYKAYVLSVYSRHNAFMIASKLSDAQIEKYLEAVTDLDKKYKLDYKLLIVILNQLIFILKNQENANGNLFLAKLTLRIALP